METYGPLPEVSSDYFRVPVKVKQKNEDAPEHTRAFIQQV